MVGANLASSAGISQAGQAYVFQNSGSTWNQIAILNASDRSNGAKFGNSISVYNDTTVVGAGNADSGGISYAGQAYVFKNSAGSTWSQIAILNASDRGASANFGVSVSVCNNTAVAGANLANIGATTDAGEAYVYTISSTTPTITGISPSSGVNTSTTSSNHHRYQLQFDRDNDREPDAERV